MKNAPPATKMGNRASKAGFLFLVGVKAQAYKEYDDRDHTDQETEVGRPDQCHVELLGSK